MDDSGTANANHPRCEILLSRRENAVRTLLCAASDIIDAGRNLRHASGDDEVCFLSGDRGLIKPMSEKYRKQRPADVGL